VFIFFIDDSILITLKHSIFQANFQVQLIGRINDSSNKYNYIEKAFLFTVIEELRVLIFCCDAINL